MNKKIIAVDLDGTLTIKKKAWNISPEEYKKITPGELENIYRNCLPNKKAIKEVERLYNLGHTIFIFTTRSSIFNSVSRTWLGLNKVCYSYIVYNKPYYDMLFDDKSRGSL